MNFVTRETVRAVVLQAEECEPGSRSSKGYCAALNRVSTMDSTLKAAGCGFWTLTLWDNNTKK